MIKLVPNIIGYHANDKEKCERFLQEKRYIITSKDTHWLGDGMYFWDNKANVNYWAKEKLRKKETQTVWIVSSHIILDNVLDLTDIEILNFINNLWNKYCLSSRYNTKKRYYLGDKLNILFSFFELPYCVIKAYASYPKAPQSSFLDDSYNDLEVKQPFIDETVKVIYCVKCKYKIQGRKKVGVRTKKDFSL